MTEANPPPTPPAVPAAATPAPTKFGFLGVLACLVFFALGALCGIAYERAHAPLLESESRYRVFLPEVAPVQNKLAARYTDANGDLVADPPADVASLQDPDTLIFSFVARKESAKDAAYFKDLMDAIAARTGKKVEYRAFTSAQEQIQAIRDGKAHVVALNTGGVPAAVAVAGFVPTVSLASDSGVTAYEMEIIVPSTSPLRLPADLKGVELVYTSSDSNSGCKAPRSILQNDFKLFANRDYTTRYSGSHEASIIGVAAKLYPAAAIANDVLARMIAAGTINPKSIRSIYKSKPFPRAAFGCPHNLKPELAGKINEVFLGFNIKGSSLEAGFQETKFTAVDFKRDWKIVREIDDASGVEYVGE